MAGTRTNLNSGIWEMLRTNTPAGGLTPFGDTQSTDPQSRDILIQTPKLSD
jgi:hypothetical protein